MPGALQGKCARPTGFCARRSTERTTTNAIRADSPRIDLLLRFTSVVRVEVYTGAPAGFASASRRKGAHSFLGLPAILPRACDRRGGPGCSWTTAARLESHS